MAALIYSFYSVRIGPGSSAETVHDSVPTIILQNTFKLLFSNTYNDIGTSYFMPIQFHVKS